LRAQIVWKPKKQKSGLKRPGNSCVCYSLLLCNTSDMDLASYIDHTLLKVDCTESDIRRLCEEAVQYKFAAVCVPPFFVPMVRQYFDGMHSQVKVATVVGFPLGYSNTPAKVEEIKRAIDDGADEIDGVINICAVKSKQWGFVQNDIDSMCTAVRLRGKKIKIILETALLTQEELEKLSEILLLTLPDFAKTSTGFNGGGATLEAVQILQHLLGNKIAIKASGGIRSREQAEAYIVAGVQRIGTSAGVQMMQKSE
jgi:deoxyribose-phosphate aldolase